MMAGYGRRRFAPSRQGPCTWGTCAPRWWLGCRRDRLGVRSCCGSRISIRRRVGRSTCARTSTTCVRSGSTGTAPLCASRNGPARYDEAISELEARGLVYPCYCTRREVLEAAHAPHDHLPEGAYPGTCRDLSEAERAEREAAGRLPAWRLRTEGELVAFEDRLAGHYEGFVDDFIVRRRDGGAAYNLAVVVDDADQGVEEVVRGDDLYLPPLARSTSPASWDWRCRRTCTCRSCSDQRVSAWPSATVR